MDSNISSKCSKLVVAAIDIGTAYSGYAFSFQSTWNKVMTPFWQVRQSITNKTPTCLLLRKDYSVVLFGYEAEDEYSYIKEDNKHEDYYFFQGFKVILHEESVNRHMLCQAHDGRSLEASVVFMHCIRYLKSHFYAKLQTACIDIKDDDIQYVLTVPAIWGDKAKVFMREAAIEAGIKNEHLIIALEPEAASIYCQYLHIAKEDTSSAVLGVVKPGTKFMVVDLGTPLSSSGTAHITVHQKSADSNSEKILMASWGPWGGKYVNDMFMTFLTELVGERVIKDFKEECMEGYLDMTRYFEAKKRKANSYRDGSTSIPIPMPFIHLCEKLHNVIDFREVIDKNELHRNNVKYTAGKLKWENKYFRGFFKKTIDSIVKHIDELFEEDVGRDVDIIVMVGGLSECHLVQDAIKKNFEQKTVIVPEEAGLAVVKGAVYLGHLSDDIPRTTLS
ncbi:heat shock 70 kDa protein 12A-like isoform X1 [Ostrea edulis]|uniref:heat shock 70 kDa protein 12A-like isoform X1 n=1 Tax=Ostrea edulis TaxID=37623 RepID=UPI0024AF3172|nr:heat shock 70 kDa protein 12A-like isoform X1 [Ostrea edulis]XP_048777352.2 heat shock 70 kDa protein 12A-like isoform X1 [Ostrea edulis]XP_048777354.2 heat shock 70 kDa protein 12A-like isoform X1 [Ostrea edulis]